MHIQIKNRWTNAVIFEGDFASLREATLKAVSSHANLTDANLTCADLTRANLIVIRDDVWAVLSAQPKEVDGLRAAIAEGRIDGSQYSGKCACLVGTIANVAHLGYENLSCLRPNSYRPAERFFLAIKEGDTPETSQFSKLALEWVDQWLARV